MKQVSVTDFPPNNSVKSGFILTPRIPRCQMSFTKLKHHLWSASSCKCAANSGAKSCNAVVNTVQPIDLHTYPKVESECGHNQTFGTYFTVKHVNIRPNVKFCHEHRETEKTNKGGIRYCSVQNVQDQCLARPCALRKEYKKCQLGYC